LIAGSLPDARKAAVRDLCDPASGALLDRALVLRFDSPATATGEDIVEFQCHGGRAVVDALLGSLSSIDGLRAAQPGEFTRRAFERGRIDLTEAEGLADLIEAQTETQRRAALALAEGGLTKQIGLWRDRLLALSAAAERAIDYDEDDAGVDPALPRECAALAAELREWLERPRIERLKDGPGRGRGPNQCREIQSSQYDSWRGAGDRDGHPGNDQGLYGGSAVTSRSPDRADRHRRAARDRRRG
jgi:tRNA modification GTPase